LNTENQTAGTRPFIKDAPFPLRNHHSIFTDDQLEKLAPTDIDSFPGAACPLSWIRTLLESSGKI